MPPKLQLDNPFWNFSLSVYAAPGVEQQCLSLQCESGIDVNLLLFCAWNGVAGSCMTASDLDRIKTAVHAWRQEVVRPLREVRSRLTGMSALHEVEIASLRRALSDVELRAEQVEQAILFREGEWTAFSPCANRGAVVRANLNLYLGFHGRGADAASALVSAAEAMT